MKRVLKLFGAIILILVLVFLSAGLIRPELEYETQTTVKRPIDTTFTLFNDQSRLGEWLTTVKSVELISGRPNEIGSKRKFITVSGGQEYEVIETLTAFEKNKLVSLNFVVGGMNKDNTYEFASEGDQTIITHKAFARGKGYIDRCFFAFFKSGFKKMDQENLDSFKKFAETN